MKKYMVIERFKPEKIKELYTRFDQKGRMLPSGLNYLDSWIDKDLTICYQLMESESIHLLFEWIELWSDLANFEVVPTISSDEAKRKLLDI